MKNRVLLLFITFILFFCSSTLWAQHTEGNNLDVNISANITGSIKTIRMRPINLAGADENNEIINIDPRSSQHAGKVVAIGNSSSKITISYPKRRKLKKVNGSSTITFTYTIAWNNRDDQYSAQMLVRRNRKFQFNKNGRFYFWIGGQANTSSATPGDYVGEFSLDIEYY